MRLTLEKYQQLEAITNDKELSELDKSLFSICAMYDLSEEQLDSYKPEKVLKMVDKISKVFGKPLTLVNPVRIGRYKIDYDINKIKFGQYLELVFFTKSNDVMNKAQYITASMAKTFYNTEHINRANYFSLCEADKVIGAAVRIKSNFDAFNATKFKALFTPYAEMQTDESAMSTWFSENFGWLFSAKSVADFEGITLEQAYKLPVTRALNDLMLLKAKGRYEYYLTHKNN